MACRKASDRAGVHQETASVVSSGRGPTGGQSAHQPLATEVTAEYICRETDVDQHTHERARQGALGAAEVPVGVPRPARRAGSA